MYDELTESSDSDSEVIEELTRHGNNKWDLFSSHRYLMARRQVAQGHGYTAFLEVTEVEGALEIVVKSNFMVAPRASKARLRNLALLLERLTFEYRFYAKVRYIDDGEIWLGYNWLFNQVIQDAVTIPILCHMVEDWAASISEPVVALVPLMHKYLSKEVSKGADFFSEADRILTLMCAPVAGNA